MNARIAAAEVAIREGRREDAIAALTAVLAEDPRQPAEVWLMLARQLYGAGRYKAGERLTAEAVARHPGDYALWNIHGVMLRQLGRAAEALEALDRAIVLGPEELGARANRGSVLLDLGQGEAARAAFAELLARTPNDPGRLLDVSRAEASLGRAASAQAHIRQALTIKPDFAEAWLQLAILADEDVDAALEALESGLAACPDHAGLAEAKVLTLRKARRRPEAEAYLEGFLGRRDGEAWAHLHLGDLIMERDRGRGIDQLRLAFALQPNLHNMTLLAQNLARVSGAEEGASLEEAYDLAREALAAGGLDASQLKVLHEVFRQVCAFEEIAQLGDFATVGRDWARSGRHSALMRQMPRVRSLDDRLELVEQHRLWGRDVEANAAADPIDKPPARPADGRIRLGLMSSDLRRHPVGYFAAPLFDHLDPRFDVFVYSFFSGPEDALQSSIAGRAAAFRRMPEATAREVAQAIANDRLDMVIELAGTTAMNRLEALAWRPAPRQASWLGYPHSVGLDAIDHMICDPFTRPADPRLMIETPLILPRTWISFGREAFGDQHAIEPGLPEERAGALTFGTANNPYKYTPEVLRTWARITAAVPGARFAFIRPEGGAASFRDHVLAAFAAEGVAEDRVIFHPVRGAHMALYNQVDISLDTFPLTGGTTTAEALWMGVPVVSLRGAAFYERLSSSILTNAGLGDLVSDDLEGFEAAALALAADRTRRAALRRGLRNQIRQGVLGDTEAFARDFYAAIAGLVTGG